MRDAVEVVDGAVDGIDDPLERAVSAAGYTFLAENGVVWKLGEEFLSDKILTADIEFEFDVVCFKGVNVQCAAEILAEEIAGGECGFNCGLERRFHGESFPVGDGGRNR
jgi:hypothetical protein